MAEAGRVLVYGGKGALGSNCVSLFKKNNYWVGSIDLTENPEADYNIVLPRDLSFSDQEKLVLDSLEKTLKDSKLDGIFCVAGGWAGGNAQKDLVKNTDLMWRQSVWSSTISATIAANYLKENGVLTLTGANAALEGTPGMIGYGLAKAAVHQLTKSLAGEKSGLPNGSFVTAILPITLDTPMNRKWMPKADFSTWTPLSFIGELFLDWTKNQNRPANGSLLKLETISGVTNVIPA